MYIYTSVSVDFCEPEPYARAILDIARVVKIFPMCGSPYLVEVRTCTNPLKGLTIVPLIKAVGGSFSITYIDCRESNRQEILLSYFLSLRSNSPNLNDQARPASFLLRLVNM